MFYNLLYTKKPRIAVDSRRIYAIIKPMTENTAPTKQRIIIRFGKADALKYTSNLDTAKIWERVLRRANLPILYTAGFNTRPRIQLAAALPLGITSEYELLDVSLKAPIPLDSLIEQLKAVSPAGLQIYSVKEENIRNPALQTRVRSGEYHVQFVDPVPVPLQESVDALLAQTRIIKIIEGQRRRSSFDLRPLIEGIQVIASDQLHLHLSAGSQGSVRPEDILKEMNLDTVYHTVHRTKLHLLDER